MRVLLLSISIVWAMRAVCGTVDQDGLSASAVLLVAPSTIKPIKPDTMHPVDQTALPVVSHDRSLNRLLKDRLSLMNEQLSTRLHRQHAPSAISFQLKAIHGTPHHYQAIIWVSGHDDRVQVGDYLPPHHWHVSQITDHALVMSDRENRHHQTLLIEGIDDSAY